MPLCNYNLEFLKHIKTFPISELIDYAMQCNKNNSIHKITWCKLCRDRHNFYMILSTWFLCFQHYFFPWTIHFIASFEHTYKWDNYLRRSNGKNHADSMRIMQRLVDPPICIISTRKHWGSMCSCLLGYWLLELCFPWGTFVVFWIVAMVNVKCDQTFITTQRGWRRPADDHGNIITLLIKPNLSFFVLFLTAHTVACTIASDVAFSSTDN